MEVQRILCLIALLNLSCAQELPCNVTQTSEGTLYSVPDFQASGCNYHWANASGHVLANRKEKIDEVVLKSSDRSVLTPKCMPLLNYTRDCISEGMQRTAYCATDCKEGKEELHRFYWIVMTSFSILALLALLVLLGTNCRRRNNPPSTNNLEALLA